MKFLEMMNLKKAKKESKSAYADINGELAAVVSDAWEVDGKPIAKSKVLTNKDFDGESGFKKGMENAIFNMEKHFIPKIMTLSEATGMPEDPFTPLVISNELGWKGAAMILLPNVIRQIRNRAGYGHGFFVLPSSIHEVIVMPGGEIEPSKLRQMVRDINRDLVTSDEWLSDEIFWVSEDTFYLRPVKE